MPAGIEIIGDHGSVILDENYSNLALRLKGTATLSSIGTGPRGNSVDIDVTGLGLNRPMVAIRCPGPGMVGFGHFSRTGNRLRFHGTAGQSFTYYVFDTPIMTTTTNGLKIWNAAGDLVFDSNQKYARVRDVQNFTTLSGVTGYPRTLTYESGREYAVICPRASAKRNDVERSGLGGTCGPQERRYRVNSYIVSSNTSGATVNIGLTHYSNLYDGYSECLNDGKHGGSGNAAVRTPLYIVDVTGY